MPPDGGRFGATLSCVAGSAPPQILRAQTPTLDSKRRTFEISKSATGGAKSLAGRRMGPIRLGSCAGRAKRDQDASQIAPFHLPDPMLGEPDGASRREARTRERRHHHGGDREDPIWDAANG
jgi:hypothetical protein